MLIKIDLIVILLAFFVKDFLERLQNPLTALQGEEYFSGENCCLPIINNGCFGFRL